MKSKLRAVAAAATTAVLAFTLVGCSSASPEDTVESAINALLDDMQEGRINEAYDRFSSKNPFAGMFGDKNAYTPDMVGEYTKRSIDEVSTYGKGKKVGYYITFSFNIGDDRITKEIEASQEDGKDVKFTSSTDVMFGTMGLSTSTLTDSGSNYPPYSMMGGVLVQIGGVPFKAEDDGQTEWIGKYVPIGDYKVEVRTNDQIVADVDDGDTLKVRPGESGGIVNLAVNEQVANDMAQSNWEGLQDAISRCAAVSVTVPSTCDTFRESAETTPSWKVTNSVYLNSVDTDNATAYSPLSSDRSVSILEAPVILGGTVVRERVGGNSDPQTLTATASVMLRSPGGEVGFKIKLERAE